MTLASDLAEHAFVIVVRDLEGFGSRLNNPHRRALRRITETCSSMASGEVTGRFAFDLPTGCGKTQSVIAWCQAVHETQSGHSVVIAASKVEELCDIKRKLIGKGVPEGSIGLIHSKDYDPARAEEWQQSRDPTVLTTGRSGKQFASLPSTTDNETRPILLVTHSRMQSRRTNIGLLNSFNGRPRDLVIWDESLLVSESRGLGKRDIDSALAWLRTWDAEAQTHREVVSYLGECVDRLNAELDAQKQHHRRPRAIRLPLRTEFELEHYGKQLGNLVQTKPLKTLLKFSQGDLRVIPVNQGGGAFVSYDITVPRALENIVVLDASYPIRELERLDPTIQHAPDFDGAVKRYDNVTIHHLRHGSGRSAMERSFAENKAEARVISRELCDVIRGIPEDEGIIVFTFKPDDVPRPVDMQEVLKRDLKSAGVATEAAIKTDNGDTKPRFRFLTWGQETAINDHKDCCNVVFAGVIHRSEPDLSAAIVGQQDDLLTDVPGSLIADVRRSENAHALYQAMSRGSCRDTVDGQAEAMRVWLIHYDDKIRNLIDKVMPGVVWETWEPKHLDPTVTKVEETTLNILAYLRSLAATVRSISSTALKRRLGLTDMPVTTFTRAMRKAVAEDPNWSLYGRSLHRSGFVSLPT